MSKAKVIDLPVAPIQHITLKRKMTQAPAQIKGPRGDMENFSFARWLVAKFEETTTGTPAKFKAPFEAAWYAKASLRESIGADGGFLAPEEWRADYFRILRGGLILNKLDVRIFDTKYRVSHVPWGTGEWTWNYPGENATITAGDRTTTQQTFTFRKGTALSNLPRELVHDAPDIADQWLKQDAASSAAHEIDKQALLGDGLGGRPLGLVNQSFVNSLTLFNDAGNGATPTYQDVTNGIAQISFLGNTSLIIGGAAECNGAVTAPRFGQTLDNINSDAGVPIWQYGLSNDKDMPNQPRWLGVRNWVLSALIPTTKTVGSSGDCSYLIFGDWRYFVLMYRQDFEFSITNEGQGFQNDEYQVKTLARYDAQALFPFAFAFYQGVRG